MDNRVNIYSVISTNASSVSSSSFGDGETTRITNGFDEDEVDSLVATLPSTTIATCINSTPASNYCQLTTNSKQHSLDEFTDSDLILLQLDDNSWHPDLLDETDPLLCLDLDPMAALFAFNASCNNSPSYR